MLLQITHETTYHYAPPVKTAQHMAHLKPADNERQRLVSHQLSISPTPAQFSESSDVHGNGRAFFSLTTRHDELKVVARSVVSTSPSPQVDSSMPWEQARERLRYHRDAAYDPASGFVFASPYVPRQDDFVAYATPSFRPGRPLFESARDLMERIHDEFAYEPQATDVGTPAAEALALRQGVCQDFAHVMLACLRSLGLPARYVSGYLLTQPAADGARLVGSDASHAWVSVYLPGDGHPGTWVDFDPTNRRAPGEQYVVVAVGRDYSDVSPIRGVIQGGANHRLQVGVTVMPIEPGDAGAPTIAGSSQETP